MVWIPPIATFLDRRNALHLRPKMDATVRHATRPPLSFSLRQLYYRGNAQVGQSIPLAVLLIHEGCRWLTRSQIPVVHYILGSSHLTSEKKGCFEGSCSSPANELHALQLVQLISHQCISDLARERKLYMHECVVLCPYFVPIVVLVPSMDHAFQARSEGSWCGTEQSTGPSLSVISRLHTQRNKSTPGWALLSRGRGALHTGHNSVALPTRLLSHPLTVQPEDQPKSSRHTLNELVTFISTV